MPAITRAISITNFVVACSALCFQVGVLYPWHKELDENFEKLKEEHLRVLASIKDTAAAAAEREGRLGSQAQVQAREGGRKPGLREWLGLGTRSLE